jgi:hypothetical protein
VTISMKPLPMLLAAATIAAIAPIGRAAQTSHTSFSTHTPSHKYDFSLVTMDGNVSSWGSWDSSDFTRLRERTKEDTLYVRKNGQWYAITDRGVVGQTKAAMEPMQKLGKQQGELGRQQGELGKQQAKLGRAQGELGRKMAEAGRELGRRVRGGGPSKDIDSQMKDLSAQMSSLGKDQSALGAKQSALGAKQGELGRQQSDAARQAEAKVDGYIDDAFARGFAHKI